MGGEEVRIRQELRRPTVLARRGLRAPRLPDRVRRRGQSAVFDPLQNHAPLQRQRYPLLPIWSCAHDILEPWRVQLRDNRSVRHIRERCGRQHELHHEPCEYLIEAAPDLRDIIRALDDENRRATTKELPKYNYPPAIVTAAGINYLAVHHTPFKVRREEAVFIRKMDAQVGSDKALFGGGFLLTEEAAMRRAAAERAAATVWQLSAREIAMQKLMIRK